MSKKGEEGKEKERAFLENGSKVLAKLIVSCNGKPIPIWSFTVQQLHQATNNYHNHLGTYWFKGSLEGRLVLVKRFLDSKFLADFVINDLVISAQMSAHANVLKLMGCCLETTSPILVYEFAANGLLADQIYSSHVIERQHQLMAWERKLKIARQIAYAISYLHIGFSRPVIHMAIDMESILLDENDVPKLSNFLVSVSIPEGETEVEATGDFWSSKFKTPEIEATGKATEKTDVYHFSEFLLELLTGEELYIDKDSSLKAYIHNHAQGRCISKIMDPTILAEQQLQAVLDLTLRCTEEDPQRRATMVDVTKELRRIERFVPYD
ncbi:non-functional pseudokinase ZED1-like [Quercus lobata]|uniref:Protein kinase domain-containing protein n=1 Tax=Quercus lobata TaxID=97700 RepID=A0A7N2M6S6_QUELO|nr:non-functional pseudokinase ZED1-like [Quercus lobata]